MSDSYKTDPLCSEIPERETSLTIAFNPRQVSAIRYLANYSANYQQVEYTAQCGELSYLVEVRRIVPNTDIYDFVFNDGEAMRVRCCPRSLNNARFEFDSRLKASCRISGRCTDEKTLGKQVALIGEFLNRTNHNNRRFFRVNYPVYEDF